MKITKTEIKNMVKPSRQGRTQKTQKTKKFDKDNLNYH